MNDIKVRITNSDPYEIVNIESRNVIRKRDRAMNRDGNIVLSRAMRITLQSLLLINFSSCIIRTKLYQ